MKNVVYILILLSITSACFNYSIMNEEKIEMTNNDFFTHENCQKLIRYISAHGKYDDLNKYKFTIVLQYRLTNQLMLDIYDKFNGETHHIIVDDEKKKVSRFSKSNLTEKDIQNTNKIIQKILKEISK